MAEGGNPLVADRVDSTEWYTGVGIAEGIADLVSGVDSGSWVDATLGGFATTMEALGFVLDPLVSWGVAWLMEHVKPLSDALDWLAGDPDQITAYAGTWANVSKAVAAAGVELADLVRTEVASWGGDAGDAYRAGPTPRNTPRRSPTSATRLRRWARSPRVRRCWCPWCGSWSGT